MTMLATRRTERAARRTRLVVDISDIQVSNDPACEIVTYALGSCIAVIVYDPRLRVGGMLHYMLPSAQVAPTQAEQRPAMFADTGIPLLFDQIYSFGCRDVDLIVKAAGGGKLYDADGPFDIGRRNYLKLNELFRSRRITIAAEDVGGCKSRTVRMAIDSGRIIVRSGRDEVEL